MRFFLFLLYILSFKCFWFSLFSCFQCSEMLEPLSKKAATRFLLLVAACFHFLALLVLFELVVLQPIYCVVGIFGVDPHRDFPFSSALPPLTLYRRDDDNVVSQGQK